MIYLTSIETAKKYGAPVNVINLPEIIGKGYKKFWNFRGRYLACKGSRGSKKSCTQALKLIYNIMKYPDSNALVIRRFFNTHKDSTYAQLQWACNRLGVSHLWYFPKGELRATYLPTGQQILFRGLDDPLKITSITVEKGYLCWVWWEEAYECTDEEAFNKVDMSIRGKLPDHLWYQHTFTFNPWSDKIWIKQRFFDITDDPDILAMTTNYMCNEFLDESYLKIFEVMKEKYPRRYKIEGLGEWGIAEGLVYDNWVEYEFDHTEFEGLVWKDTGEPVYTKCFGLDFGYTNDPTAFVAFYVRKDTMEIFIYDEIYEKRLKNTDIFSRIRRKGYEHEKIEADSADPKSIDELEEMGLYNIHGCPKPAGSVLAGIQKLQDYTIFVHPRCTNTIIELNNYQWDKDKLTGKFINKPVDDFNHIMDAMRYGAYEIGLDEITF